MAAKKKHFKEYECGKHTPAKGCDDGACLTGHESDYTKNSCSYRWQSLEESKKNRTGIYNRPITWAKVKKDVLAERDVEKKAKLGSEEVLATSSYWTRKRRQYPGGYAQKIALPKGKDWHVGGPAASSLKEANGKRYVPAGRNFEKMLWPYWNNAHHLIPKGTLKSFIEHKDLSSPCKKLIKGALLKAKYNINHHINVILLPMDKEVALVLGLPRHLVLEDETTLADAVEKAPKFDHIGYNITVATELKDVIADYKSKCDQELQKECIAEDFTLSKAKLENLSKRCYAAVIKAGAANPGRPISEIASLPPLKAS